MGEPAVSTVVMKIELHCEGCANKIKRAISKHIDGVYSVKTDLNKDLVTVIGTMNVKELTSYLKEKFKRNIEIIPPPKKDDGGKDKKEKKGRETKAAAGESSKGGEKKGRETKAAARESSKGGDQSYYNQDYGHLMNHYQDSPPNYPPPPRYMNDQMFSDENPNGCSVM